MVCRKCFLQNISSWRSPSEDRKEDTMVEGEEEEVSMRESHLEKMMLLVTT